MIATVSLSADALLDDCVSGQRFDDLHQRLAQLLLAHGQLVFADLAAEAYFHERVRKLEQVSAVAAKAWELLALYGRSTRASRASVQAVEELVDLTDLVDSWDGVVEAVLMEPGRAAMLGFEPPAVAWWCPSGQLEVVCHDTPTGSQTLAALQRLRETTSIPRGSDRDQIWTQRLKPLVRVSRQVHVLDKYLGSGLLKSDGRARGLQETEWLLRRIADDANGATVTFYTARPDHSDPGWLANRFRSAIRRIIGRNGRVARVLLYAVDASDWKPHDRHVRADKAGIEMSNGFDRLRSQALWQDTTLTYKYAHDVQKLRDAENSVRYRHAGHPITLL